MGSKYYVVKEQAVPEVLLKVVEAKKLLDKGRVSTINEAADRVGISRSSFYKYKDDIFQFHDNAQGTTIFLSSHVLSEVKSYCKNAAVIKDGRILRSDTVENLSRSDLRLVRLKEDGETKKFSYTGNMKELIKNLADRNVEDILIEEPSLEELFMRFYEREEEKES